MQNKIKILLFLTFVSLFSVGQIAQAYFSTMDTGDILSSGQYRLSAESQVALGSASGLNLVSRFDAGVSDSSNVRILLGTGRTNFQWGMLYKYVPYPDFEKQPALGIMAGFIYARQDDSNYLNLRIHPIVSKKMTFDGGEWTPFASLPTGLIFSTGKTIVPIQCALGVELKPDGFNKLSFMAEAGVNLLDSFNYISIGALYRLDNSGPRVTPEN